MRAAPRVARALWAKGHTLWAKASLRERGEGTSWSALHLTFTEGKSSLWASRWGMADACVTAQRRGGAWRVSEGLAERWESISWRSAFKVARACGPSQRGAATSLRTFTCLTRSFRTLRRSVTRRPASHARCITASHRTGTMPLVSAVLTWPLQTLLGRVPHLAAHVTLSRPRLPCDAGDHNQQHTNKQQRLHLVGTT